MDIEEGKLGTDATEHTINKSSGESESVWYKYDYPQHYRWVVSVFTLFSMCLLGPPFMNWVPLRDTFGDAGAFNYLCDNPLNLIDIMCDAKFTKLENLGGLSISVYFLSIVFCGLILDTLGGKLCTLIGLSVTCLGWIIISFSGPKFNGFTAGMILIAISVDCAFMGLISVSNLFPNYSSTAVAVMGACRSLSFAVPVVMQELFKVTHSLMMIGLGFCVILLICACGVMILIPRRQFPRMNPTASSLLQQPTKVSLSQHMKTPQEFKKINIREMIQSQLQFLKKYGTNIPFIAFVMVLCSSLLLNGYYVETTASHIGHAENFYKIMSPLSFIPCPFLGLLVDKVSPILTCGFLALCGAIALGICFIQSIISQYISVLFNWVFVSFTASQCYCYISFTYPPSELGRLSGLSFFVAGLVLLSANSMNIFAKSSVKNRVIMECLLLVIAFLAICTTLFLFFFVERPKKKKDKMTEAYS